MAKPKPTRGDTQAAAAFLAGLAIALAGVACYDWRAGLIATGVAVAGLAVLILSESD